MPRRLLTAIQGLGTWPAMLGLLAVVGVLSFVMNGTRLPFTTPTIEEHSGGLRLLDMRLSYGPDEAYRLFEALGPDGRRADLLLHLLPDVLFPIGYSLLFAAIGAWFLVRLLPPGHPAQWLALTPLISGAADLSENLTLVVANVVYPTRLDGLIHVAAVVTAIKWGLMPIGVVLLIGIAMWWLARGRPERRLAIGA